MLSSMADSKQIVHILHHTLNADGNVVRSATELLDSLSLTPDFPFSLLTIVAGCEDHGVRIAAATYLKNLLRRSLYGEGQPGSVSKEFRNQLLRALLHTEPSILKVLVEAFRIIVQVEFVMNNDWPEIVPELKYAIQHSNFINGQIKGELRTLNALTVLQALVRPFQYFLNPKVVKEPVPLQLELIANEILVPLLAVFHNFISKGLAVNGIIDVEIEKILLLVGKCMYYTVRSYMPSALSPLLSSFCGDLYSILDSLSVDKMLSSEDAWQVRVKMGKRSLLIFCSLITRHRKYCDKLMPEIVNCVLRIVKHSKDISKLNTFPERIFSSAFDVISHVLETGPGWRLVSPHFSTLLDYAILPAILLNDKDTMEWEENADEFLRKNFPSDLDDISGWRDDLFTARKSAINLLGVISMSKGPPLVTSGSSRASSKRKKGEKNKGKHQRCSMGELLVIPFLSKFPIPTDANASDISTMHNYFGVLMGYGGLQDFLSEQKTEYTSALIQIRILPLYKVHSTLPFLVAAANWVLGELAACLSDDIRTDVYSALLKALAMPDPEIMSCYPVRVTAAGAIAKLLDNDYSPPEWLPLLQVIIQSVGCEVEDASFLFQLLSSAVEVGSAEVAVHVPSVVPTLADIILKCIPSDQEPWPQVVERGFAALTVMANTWQEFESNEVAAELDTDFASGRATIARAFSALLQQAWLVNRQTEAMMDSQEHISSNATSQSRDPGNKYGRADVKDKNIWYCNFCQKRLSGGVHRLKQHLAGGFRNATKCLKCPVEVRQEIIVFMKEKAETKSSNQIMPDLSQYDNDECDEEEVDVESHLSIKRKRQTKGPMDMFITKKKAQGTSGKQAEINKVCDKAIRDKACADIARFFYDAGIAFNAATYPSFHTMIESIGQYGPEMKGPSMYELRVPLLRNEVEETHKQMDDHKKEWIEKGCSIISDGWRDSVVQKDIVNFLVNSPKGSMFIKSMDVSEIVKDSTLLFHLLDNMVEEIGEKNVIQVVTDNASNYVKAGQMLMGKRTNLYWTPCAAHCVDLILEDIGKLARLKSALKKCMFMNAYIYSHISLVNMMRRFTNQRNLHRPAITRFATSFITLEQFHRQKSNLRKMVTSQEWLDSKWPKEAGGKKVASFILQDTFWRNVVYALKLGGPLIKVLRIVDGERKPPMGYIYEAMDRAKEAIAKSFSMKEDYAKAFEFIDKRWNCQLHRPLHAAGYFLNPEFQYDNPASRCSEVMDGLYDCIERLIPKIEDQDKITKEVELFQNASGLFGKAMAIRQRKTRSPAEWWIAFGASAPNLQKFAVRILSLTCSATGCERNWAVFQHDDDGDSCQQCVDDASILLGFITLSVDSTKTLLELNLSKLLVVWSEQIANWHAWEESEDFPVFDCIKEVVNLLRNFDMWNFFEQMMPSPPSPPLPKQSILQHICAFVGEAITQHPSAMRRACLSIHTLLHGLNYSFGREDLKKSLVVTFSEAAVSRFRETNLMSSALRKPLLLAIASCYLCYPDKVEKILDKDEGGFVVWVSALRSNLSSSSEANTSSESEIKLTVITLAKLADQLVQKGNLFNVLSQQCFNSLLEACIRMKEIQQHKDVDEEEEAEDDDDGDDDDDDDETDEDEDKFREETEEEFLERYAKAAAALEDNSGIEEGDEEDDEDLEFEFIEEFDEQNTLRYIFEKYQQVLQGHAISPELSSMFLDSFPEYKPFFHH